MKNIFQLFAFFLLSACSTAINVECGSDAANGLNATLNQLSNQTLIVQNGYKVKTETTSTPYVTQYWNGYQYVSRTNYDFNTVTREVPVNLNYETKVLRNDLKNMIAYLQYAKNTKSSCEQKGLGTFTLNESMVEEAIGQANFVLN